MKIGCIGAGAITRRAHLPAWRRIPEVDVTVLCDLDSALAKDVASEFLVGTTTDDFQTILNDSSIDIVDICTPTPTHYAIATAALRAGKHVIIEKPLVLKLEEAVDLYDLSRSTDLKLCVIQNWRYLDSVFSARDVLKVGRLGKVVTMHGKAFNHLPVGWTRSTWLYHRYAVLYDFTPHLIDLILWLCHAQVEEIVAYGHNFTEQADFLSSAQILIQFSDDLVALLDTAWDVNYPAFDVQIYGTGGRLSLDLRRDFFEESRSGETPISRTRTYIRRMLNIARGVMAGNILTKPFLIYKSIFEEFLTSVREHGEPPMTLDQGVWVNIVLEAAKLSIREGRPVSAEDILSQAGASSDLIAQLRKSRGSFH
jgi:predicted dehydrogenase